MVAGAACIAAGGLIALIACVGGGKISAGCLTEQHLSNKEITLTNSKKHTRTKILIGFQILAGFLAVKAGYDPEVGLFEATFARRLRNATTDGLACLITTDETEAEPAGRSASSGSHCTAFGRRLRQTVCETKVTPASTTTKCTSANTKTANEVIRTKLEHTIR
ncbi:unnamed protein product [Ceratitis capitata]|uniref:(Mediterranean fruit fly) hypothetical protein n=1 Tax=Ceratitis capitata TaxID=7213 RepID=A0A811UXQ4_CERCA|nr:unnamed protein product [Ceratitis capitata]